MTAQVRQRAAHADEIVDHDVICASGHRAVEGWLPRQPGKPVGAGMRNHIGLYHAAIDQPAKSFCHHVGQNFGNRIHALTLVGMRADEHGLCVANQCAQTLRQRIVKDIPTRSRAAPASPLLAAR